MTGAALETEGEPMMKNVAEQENRLLGFLAFGCYAATLIALVCLWYALASLYRDFISEQLFIVRYLH